MNSKKSPCFTDFLDVITKRKNVEKVSLFEIFSEPEVEYEILKRLDLLEPEDSSLSREEYINCWSTGSEKLLKRHIKYMHNLGYDYINVGPRGFNFFIPEWSSTETRKGKRSYVQGSDQAIKDYDDFEKYPWPQVTSIDNSPYDMAKSLIPDGMKIISGFGGILEHVIFLLGYDGISYLLFDNPQLVRDTFREVATRIISYFKTLASVDMVGVLVMGDDMGFKTGTILSPQVYREYLFPWHKKLVEAVHDQGKPVIIHSCGNLVEVMDDIIDCGWDGKHSFEDVIQPVWEAKKMYGDRISLLGGFDMDKICRMSEDEARAHTRMLIKRCQPGGGWALGTGNSVADYIEIDNFLAMIGESGAAAF